MLMLPGGKFGGRSGGQSGLLVQSYDSPVEHRFLVGLDWSINSPLLDCDHKYVSVRTMPPGLLGLINDLFTAAINIS